MGELGRLQQEGKIRCIGVSNFSVAEVERARSVVEVVSEQNSHNFLSRRSDDVLAMCEREITVFIPHTPQAAEAQAGGKDSPRITALAAVAKKRGISMAQAAPARLLARSPAILPNPGTSSMARLEENVAAAAVKLGVADMTRIG